MFLIKLFYIVTGFYILSITHGLIVDNATDTAYIAMHENILRFKSISECIVDIYINLDSRCHILPQFLSIGLPQTPKNNTAS